MYAFIDETGNTGPNLFDPGQPVFITGALMTRGNFDLLYRGRIRSAARQLGVDVLHANELGMGRLEEIAPDLLRVFKRSDARIFVARVVKLDLAAMKLVDTIFDSGENLAVPWFSYNAIPLRLLLTIKVAYLLDEEIIKLFWSCLIDKNEERAYKKFLRVLTMLLPRTESLPDARSQTIVKDAIEWALENPEAIQIYCRTPAFKYAHLPNIAVFPQVLGGIERKSREWRRNVIEIVHDQQSQFGPTLKGWHDLTSNAKPGSITLLGGEKVEVRSVAGSKLVISDAESSAGIQLIDVILWLFKRLSDGDALPENCLDFMNYVIRMGGMYDLSLENISRYLSETLTRLEDVALSEEQLKKAQELLEFDEERRQEKMLMYYEQKVKATKT